MEKDLKEKLERNIWITRKCRINASERLLRSAKFVEFLNVYYSIFVITLSLLSLYLQKIPVGVSTAYGKVDSIHFFSLDLTVVLYVIMITQIDCYKGPHISRPSPSVRRDFRLP